MQNAKDTFYTTLQARLAAVNPARTMVVRGVTRPAVLVEENELPSDAVPVDAFRLRWVGLKTDSNGALPLVAMSCEIRYATDGNAGNGGMDRGRLLAAMDAELAAAARMSPRSTAKISYSTAPPTTLGTNVFWGDVSFAAAVVTDERLERVATVEIFYYQEAGEL
ncbi:MULTISPECIES: hypothetical protein [Acidobacteriaceae]|uniref:hypothetical protein n=1 Tax=Acidobacteriaceae TaxID=204434 RepID=UPI00131A7AD2|nr:MULTISPECIES: hypothetical protein [Acidobacteriaceae]MDW5265708.1 hypothetical protein [Edaphobacter sp.]